MFIVSLNYIQPLAAVDALLPQHVAWLERYFEQGIFLSAGRKNPRTGGMILVKSMPRPQLEQILEQDPFQRVAEYEITEVSFSRTATGLEQLSE